MITSTFIINVMVCDSISYYITIVSISRTVWPQVILLTNRQINRIWYIIVDDPRLLMISVKTAHHHRKVNLCQTAGKGKPTQTAKDGDSCVISQKTLIKKPCIDYMHHFTSISTVRLHRQITIVLQSYPAVTHSSTNRARRRPTLWMGNLINSGCHLDLRWMKTHSFSLAT